MDMGHNGMDNMWHAIDTDVLKSWHSDSPYIFGNPYRPLV